LIRKEIDIWFWIIAVSPLVISHYIFNIYWYPEPIDFIVSDLKYKFVFGNKKYAIEFEKSNKEDLFDMGQLFNFKN
jgi:hypothetical protein